MRCATPSPCSGTANPTARRGGQQSLPWREAPEERRALLKAELFSKDEAALFVIMNEFNVRHSNERQRDDYDSAFLEWTFRWYLATIALTDELISRRSD